MRRIIDPQPLKPPPKLTVIDQFHRFHLDDISHLPGEAAAIRFFDPKSREDYHAVQTILSSPDVKAWMDEAGQLSFQEYRSWAGKHTADSFLFAVHDSRLSTLPAIKTVRGFVNIYSEREEKFRIKRLRKLGFFAGVPRRQTILEVSLAANPPVKNQPPTGPGLMSSALRQSCLQVRSLLDNPKNSELILFGFADPENPASIRVMEAAGFVFKGRLKYDPDSEDESLLYLLSWPKLMQKTQAKMVNRVGRYVKILPEPQKTDSHCGPAVLKGLLRFHQINVSQDDIVNAVNLKKRIIRYGMRPVHLYQALTNLAPDLRFWYKQEGTIKDLSTLVHQLNLPVGVNWQGLFYDSVREETKNKPHGDNGHYSVVVDIDRPAGKITIDDPYTEYFNRPRIFSYRWFKKRWWDTDMVFTQEIKTKTPIQTKRLLFIIASKNLTLPSSLHLKTGKELEHWEQQLIAAAK